LISEKKEKRRRKKILCGLRRNLEEEFSYEFING
jgi:hypothetical protein